MYLSFQRRLESMFCHSSFFLDKLLLLSNLNYFFMTQYQTITNEDIEIVVEALGKKLGLLISASTMTDEMKQALLDILPAMTPEQIDNLINILEAKYLDEQTGGLNDKLAKDLDKIMNDSNTALDKIDGELLVKLKRLNKSIVAEVKP